MKTPKRPTLGKIRTGFLPVGMGQASATSVNAQKHSPLPGSGSGGNSGYRYKLNLAGVDRKRGKKMY